jgi:signal transduction histidine kinase
MSAPTDGNVAKSGGATETKGSQQPARTRSGLLTRIAIALGALAAGLVILFVVLIVAVTGLRDRSVEARHAEQVIATANGLQTLVIDFETGLRGFVITRQDRFLDPWRKAQHAYPKEVKLLIAQTANDPEQNTRALHIRQAVDSYLNVYSIDVMQFLRRNPQALRAVALHAEAPVAAIRKLFSTFLATEATRGVRSNDQARDTARSAVVVAIASLGAVLLFLLAAGVYLARAVARPVRSVATAAEEIAAGDLSPRLPIEGPGEVGQLERSFNAMADSLERQRAELEERNQQLVESERLKTDLVSNVSHELRTPLSSILGFSDLMLKREVAPEDRRRYLEVIRAESARLATLLNDLLDLQRQELGVLELRLTEFDLNELLEVQVTLYSAQSSVHEVVLSPSPEPVMIKGDPDRLAQVIGNLLSNAIKYSPDGGNVDVTASLIRGEGWIWVRDRGLGIPHDHQDRVFTKFFRGEAARKRAISGTGLGLVLARQIVEAHGGSIGFNSEEGRGSTFWVRLPAASQIESIPTADDAAETRHRV